MSCPTVSEFTLAHFCSVILLQKVKLYYSKFNKDKVVLGECLAFSVLLKMNAVHIYLTDFNYSFFQQYLHFETSSNFMVFILFAICCCYGDQLNLLIIRDRKTRDTPKCCIMYALLNGRLKLIVMVALLPW